MKILFIFFHGIGDAIMFTPAIRMLKNKYPKINIGIFCQEKIAEIFRVNPNISQVISSELKNPPYGIWPKFLIERYKIMKAARKIAKEYGFDKIIFLVPHGFNSFIPIPGILFSVLPVLFRLDKNEIKKLCNLLGVGSGKKWPEEFVPDIFYNKKEYEKGKRYVEKIKKKVAVVHLSSLSERRGFTKKEKKEILDSLNKKYKIILIGEEVDDDDIISIKPETFSFSIGMMDNADLFIGTDSGPANIAAYLKTKSIIISKVIPPHLRFIPRKSLELIYKFDSEKIKKAIIKFSE